MNAMKKLICLLLMLCAGTAAFAWGGREHRLIAYIAEAHLTPRTRQVLDRYLDQSIVEYSTWMDRYRTAPGYEITTYWHMVTIDKDGNVVKDGASKDEDGFAVEDKNISDSNLPLYVCKVNGETKYVIPVTGKGLWDAIWGYVALNADKNTIYGVYFTHKGETAGLGSIITEYDKFQKQFEGKKLMNDDKSAVAISVVKKGKVVNGLSDDSRCDAITGATLTSDGVNNMLHDCISRYMTFLNTNE